MAKVSRAYIKSAGQDQSGSIQAGSTIYAQDILDLIDSAKWRDEGIDNVYYDDTNHGIMIVKSSDPARPVFIPVPKGSDIVNKLVKGTDKYELRSDTGLVAETDLPSTLVTSVTCDNATNELHVSSTSSKSDITVQLPDSLKSAAIEGNDIKFTSLDGKQSVISLPDSLKSVSIEGSDITFTSLDGQQSVVNIPDSLKSVSIDGNTLTFTSLNDAKSVINLPVTTGYLSNVSLKGGTLVFTKDGSSDVRITLPFVSKAITGVSLQGSNLVFTFSDNTTANITLPTQSEEGTAAGLLSGVRIDGNKMIFTVSGGNDITIELPSTSGGSESVDLTGLLFNPSYSLGRLSFKVKGSDTATSVDLDGIAKIDGLSGDNLDYEDLKGNQHQVSLSNLAKGVLKDASVSGDNLVFTTKDSDNISIPLSSLTAKGALISAYVSGDNLVFPAKGGDATTIPFRNLTASGVLTGVSLSNGNLVFTVKGGDDITIPLSSSSSSGVTDVIVESNKKLSVTKDGSKTYYNILPRYSAEKTTGDKNNKGYYGWGGSLVCVDDVSDATNSYSPIGVPTSFSYMSDVIQSNVGFSNRQTIGIGSNNSVSVEKGQINSWNVPRSDTSPYDSYNNINVLYCALPFSSSFSESSGTFTANVISVNNLDYVLAGNYMHPKLNGNILEIYPDKNTASIVHLLQKSNTMSVFNGFALTCGNFVILLKKYMFFATKVYDWNYTEIQSYGLRCYLGSSITSDYSSTVYATAGKVLE